jgi:hypothetical protein
MSTEQDAASPAAAVLERRQRRTTPQKRKQVCSDSDSEESETGSDGEWSGDDDPLSDHGREDEDEDEPVLRGRKADETSCSEEEGEEEEHVSNAQRGCVRLHGVVQSSTGLEVDDDRRKRLGEKGWARRSVVVCAVGPSGAAVFEAVLGREEYGSGEDGAVEWEKNMLEFADGNFNDAGMRYERRDVERQRARWHDPVLRRWLGLTPKRPALCLRGLPRRPRAALKRDKLGGIRKNRGVGGAG